MNVRTDTEDEDSSGMDCISLIETEVHVYKSDALYFHVIGKKKNVNPFHCL